MRRFRSHTLATVVALLAWSVAALLPLLHLHRTPAESAPLVTVHMPGDGHVHVAVRDYGHADTWDLPAEPGRPVDHHHPVSGDECPACLAATIMAAFGEPPSDTGWSHPVARTERFALPAARIPVRGATPSSFQARAPPSV